MEDQKINDFCEGVDDSMMNPALVFDQEDREGPHNDDREGSCVESLRILVNDFNVGVEGSPIEIKRKEAVSKSKKLMRRKNKNSFDKHICLYCDRPSSFREICKSRILNSEFVVYGMEELGRKQTWFVGVERRTHCWANKKSLHQSI
ncbi:hypothetical protein E3N88_10363 [Mikania micrantha]|uniref:Uncharacterized protein n=1 Tax=Mikania micrantha TaxID=192012 RepID=A0A5N6PC44_9ASTR|nr:hypothetical protein E3N88_10363 [Mikania micrantha]